MNLRREHYVVSEETLGYAQSSLAVHLELGNEIGTAWARFTLGFVYLWHGDLNLAEEQLQAALAVGKQAGHVTLQLFCLTYLTYLTVLYRKRGQVEETRQLGEQALAVATVLQQPNYIAMAKANLAWVAWREWRLSEAQLEGLKALELWRSAQVYYVFQWTALWPLLSGALTQDRLSEAVDHARALLSAGQHPLPQGLTEAIEEAIHAWDSDQSEAAGMHLHEAMTLAQQMGYL
jgi:tetratricopeptide (TPR) repeat protein